MKKTLNILLVISVLIAVASTLCLHRARQPHVTPAAWYDSKYNAWTVNVEYCAVKRGHSDDTETIKRAIGFLTQFTNDGAMLYFPAGDWTNYGHVMLPTSNMKARCSLPFRLQEL
jgi:hypothetical protein